MAEELIGMEDMEAIFEVTDALGIHRESVRVELTKEDPGSIQRVADGMVEITLPVNESAEVFCRKLRIDLEAMGFEPADNVLGYDDDDDEEESRPSSGPRPRLT
ncbi:MAG: hypothetical protein CL696_02330 [Chloroflexi bacterium]|jgi:hypothetical protein|nr:hypothetical protein [Chloroflexota bacterium]MDP6497670.1 hypothetical protein [Dehalococcoidia bacterium]MQG53461.1 hypothetical protein [SAR202 cluster bacterium]|tara:strand:- start:67 stop:378 length:312 start_codon:yes stop_codon:yes gene_type:complete